jgi:phage-related protein
VIADSADSGAKSGDAFGRTFNRNAKGQFASAADGTEKDAADTGDKSGSGFAVTFTRHISDMLTGFKKNMGSAGSSGGADMAKGILGGIGPGILGISTMMTAKIGGIGTALAALPALAGVIGLGIGTALIGGAVAAAIKTSPALKAQFTVIGADAKTMFANAAQPLIPAVSAVLKQVPALLKTIGPQLTDVFKEVAPQIQGIFSGLIPIISGVLGIMKAAAPVFGPVIEGLEKLVSNVLPGIETVIKAAVPFAAQFAAILGGLGKDVGGFFASAAPAIGASMKVLGALLDLIGGLLPIVMKLAGVFATALAPVITVFAGAIKSLTPFLTTLGTILSELATAVLGDLGAAFTALAGLLSAVAPALNTFARSLGIVFTTLENSGVFAILGNAIEDLVTPLGGLISALLKGLAPILPPLFTAIGKIAGILAGGLAVAVGKLLPPLTTLATKVLAAVVSVLPTVLTLFTTLAGVFTAVFVTAVTELAIALAAVVNAIPAGLLQGIVIGVLALVAAFKTAAIISVIMDAMSANPIILIAAACALLVIGITELVTHWTTVWATIKSIAGDVGSFLDNLFHNQIVQDILAIWSVGLIPLAEHWTTVWGDIKSVATGFENWLHQTFGTDLANFFTKTIPGWWDTCYAGARLFVSNIESALTGAWNWISGTFGTDIANFFTRTIPGWFSQFIGFVKSDFVTPFQNAVSGAWDWVKTNVLSPMDTFFTKTIPGWFTTSVNAIGTAWGKLEAGVEVPVKFVVNDVLNPLGQFFDDITNALGLGKPIPKLAMAGGGIVPGGYGGGDRVPALLEPGETVVDKEKSGKWAWLFRLMGVKGYATGGIIPGGGVLHDIGSAVSSVVSGIVDTAKIVAAVMTGNSTALSNALTGMVKGNGGAAGELGAILTAVPKTVITDLVSWVTGKMASTAAAVGKGGGSATPGVVTVAKYIMSHGGNKFAGAGVGGVIAGESGGDPEIMQAGGGGGEGIMQWTPGSSARPIYPIITGNPGLDMANQLVDMMAYIAGRGGLGSINAAGSAMGAAQVFSRMEAPAVAGSDIRPDVVASLYAQGYANGGMITEPVIGFGASGRSYTLGERGPEMVTPVNGAGGLGGLLARNNALMEKLIQVTAAVPAGVGSHMGSAIGGASAAASLRQRYPRGGS